jgi:DNA polymerase-3 subunit delta
MNNHYNDLGKKINRPEAEYLIHITGGLMALLKNEIEKTAAHSKNEFISRSDIDAVVIPVIDAVVYQLADALIKREHQKAMRIIDELFLMREAPQRLMFSISLKMRQLLAARVCIENNLDRAALVKMCGLAYEFQARMLFDTARKSTLDNCRQAVIECARTAVHLNSAPDPESRMVELAAKLIVD